MSDGIQIKLTGDVDVIAAFRELRKELPKNPLRRATRAAAQYLAQFIALAAPKLTGRLARNIVVRGSSSKGVTHGKVVINTAGPRGAEGNAFYWRFLEEGWHTKSGAFHQFPFIRSVFDSKSHQAAQKVIDECEVQIAKAQARIERAAGSA